MASRVASRSAPKYLQSLLGRSLPAVQTTNAFANHERSSQVHQMAPLATQTSGQFVRFFSEGKTAPPPPEEPAAEEETKTEESAEAAAEEGAAAEPEVSREEQLEAELKEAKDQLLRTLAEQENTRRIAKRDVQDARNFAVKSFAKSLLDVSDNLTRALEVVPEEMRKDAEGNATLATLYEGIEMTEAGLIKAFESNGLKKYGAAGEVFDPNLHNALYEYPDPEKEAGSIGQVIKAGYLLNERVLRPAEVGVVKKE